MIEGVGVLDGVREFDGVPVLLAVLVLDGVFDGVFVIVTDGVFVAVVDDVEESVCKELAETSPDILTFADVDGEFVTEELQEFLEEILNTEGLPEDDCIIESLAIAEEVTTTLFDTDTLSKEE